MSNIELVGFDESGLIGEKLRFVRVSTLDDCELRPFVYNLLHFGSLTASKATIKGQINEIKIRYLRRILEDENFAVYCYELPIEKQLDLMRYFTIGEFCKISNIRTGLLIKSLETDDQHTKDWKIDIAIKKLRKYAYPHKYVETFIKSFGYRMIFNEIEGKSMLHKRSHSENVKIYSFVDGGHPFVFWKDELIKNKAKNGVIKKGNLCIDGVSNGDEYFPMINIAGNVANILNYIPKANYPHNIIDVPETSKDLKKEFYQKFSKTYDKPIFSQRILFFGDIDRDLQYSLPFVIYRKNGIIYEPFRVTRSIKSFYKAFRGDSSEDLIIYGKIREKSSDKGMLKECKNYGIGAFCCSDYFDGFNEFLGDVLGESKNSNLDKTSSDKLQKKITKTKERVKLSLKK